MKRQFPALMLGLILLGPLAISAEPAPPASDKGTAATDSGGPWGEHGKYMQERLDQIHKELKLAPGQETDWKVWSDAVQQAKQARKEARPDFESFKKLSAPDRLQKLIDHSKEKQARMEEVLAATKTFYGTLSQEQRKTFDDLTPFGERAPKWKGRGGPHHSGKR